MRIGQADHVAERAVAVRPDELDGLVGQEIGGERLLVGARDVVASACRRLAGLHARAVGRVLQLLPVAAVEHVAVVLEAELPLGRPLRFAAAVECHLPA